MLVLVKYIFQNKVLIKPHQTSRVCVCARFN